MLTILTGILLPAAAAQTLETADFAGDRHIMYLFWQADPVVKLALIILFIFSIVSWAIIIMKYRQLKSAKNRSHSFLSSFWHSKTIEALIAKGAFRKSPVFNIFKSGIASLREPENAKNLAFVRRDIERTTEEEVEQLEYYVPFLATTASAAPFVGLFGTVWGILNAFWKLGRGGSSSLAVVGPHIAEALIATALGLAAAIPAVIFYNYFVNKIRLLSRDIGQFSEDFAHRIEKEYF